MRRFSTSVAASIGNERDRSESRAPNDDQPTRYRHVKRSVTAAAVLIFAAGSGGFDEVAVALLGGLGGGAE